MELSRQYEFAPHCRWPLPLRQPAWRCGSRGLAGHEEGMPLARLEPQAMRVDFTPACSRVNHSTARYPKLALLARWRHLISLEAKRGRSPSGRFARRANHLRNCWRRCAIGLPVPANRCAIAAETRCAKKLILQAASNGSAGPVHLRKIFLFRFFRN